jgi:hypothetical protein
MKMPDEHQARSGMDPNTVFQDRPPKQQGHRKNKSKQQGQKSQGWNNAPPVTQNGAPPAPGNVWHTPEQRAASPHNPQSGATHSPYQAGSQYPSKQGGYSQVQGKQQYQGQQQGQMRQQGYPSQGPQGPQSQGQYQGKQQTFHNNGGYAAPLQTAIYSPEGFTSSTINMYQASTHTEPFSCPYCPNRIPHSRYYCKKLNQQFMKNGAKMQNQGQPPPQSSLNVSGLNY